jgi:branched-chain amino acid aminotransferase
MVPVCEIDDHRIGEGVSGGGRGSITEAVQSVYVDALHGRTARYREWLDIVKVPSRSATP